MSDTPDDNDAQETAEDVVDAVTGAAEAGGAVGSVAGAASDAADTASQAADTASQSASRAREAQDRAENTLSDADEAAAGTEEAASGAKGFYEGVGTGAGAVGSVADAVGLSEVSEAAGAMKEVSGTAAKVAGVVEQVAGVAQSIFATMGPRVEYKLETKNARSPEGEAVSYWDRDDWKVLGVEIDGSLSSPYEMRFNLKTSLADADPSALVGAEASLEIKRLDKTEHFHGVIRSVRQGNRPDEKSQPVQLVVVPAFSLLQYRVMTQIFQEMTAKEILTDVLGSLGVFGREADLSALTPDNKYPKREFCVQYGESDRDFCQRIMAEEGITYYFRQDENGPEVMVLCDDTTQCPEIVTSDGKPVPMLRNRGEMVNLETVRGFTRTSRVGSTSATVTDWDWTWPKVVEKDDITSSDQHDRLILEIDNQREFIMSEYDSGNAKFQANNVERRHALLKKHHEWPKKTYSGSSWVVGLRPGYVFELQGHEQPEMDGRYLVTSVRHRKGRPPELKDRKAVEHYDYYNEFDCIPVDVPYVPDLDAYPKPRIHSTQTARVCGPDGEEIHTDEHGRVQLHFYWDWMLDLPEPHTCWVRVQQAWGGPGWGHVFIPHVGMEVVVTFINGDIDRPLVTGSVYNGENRPPYTLPDEKMKSTIKTVRNNELRFDDTEGAEQIYVHAQRDHDELVEHDHTRHVKNCETINVDVDQQQTVGNDQTELVKNNQSLTVDVDRTVHVKGKFTETIDTAEERTVTSGSTETINDGKTYTVNGGMTETINDGETRTVSGGTTETINDGETRTVNGDFTETVTGSTTQTLTGGATITTPQKYEISATAGFKLTATGGAQIIAPGGWQLIAPAGQTTVDSFFDKTGGWENSKFTGKYSVLAVKLDSVGFAGSTVGVKMDVTGTKVDICGGKMGKEAVKLENSQMVMESIAVTMVAPYLYLMM